MIVAEATRLQQMRYFKQSFVYASSSFNGTLTVELGDESHGNIVRIKRIRMSNRVMMSLLSQVTHVMPENSGIRYCQNIGCPSCVGKLWCPTGQTECCVGEQSSPTSPL